MSGTGEPVFGGTADMPPKDSWADQIQQRLAALEAKVKRHDDFVSDLLQKQLDTRLVAQRLSALEERLRVVWTAPITALEENLAALAKRVEACEKAQVDNFDLHRYFGKQTVTGAPKPPPAQEKPPEPASESGPSHGHTHLVHVQCKCGAWLKPRKIEQPVTSNSTVQEIICIVQPCPSCAPQKPPEPASETTYAPTKERLVRTSKMDGVLEMRYAPKEPEPKETSTMPESASEPTLPATEPRIECGRCGEALKPYRPSHDAWLVNPCECEKQTPQEPASETDVKCAVGTASPCEYDDADDAEECKWRDGDKCIWKQWVRLLPANMTTPNHKPASGLTMEPPSQIGGHVHRLREGEPDPASETAPACYDPDTDSYRASITVPVDLSFCNETLNTICGYAAIAATKADLNAVKDALAAKVDALRELLENKNG